MSDVPRRFFQIAVDGRDVGAVNVERKRERRSQVRDELGVRDGCRAANPMLDVDHAELQIPTRGKLAQGMQQEYRIRAARHGDADAIGLVQTCDVAR